MLRRTSRTGIGRIASLCSIVGLITPLLISLPASAQTPSGAVPSVSTMKEVHGDWAVACGDLKQGQKQSKACVVSQTQLDPRTHQRILAMELRPSVETPGATAATIVMPFGLVLARGVTVQIDNAPSGNPAPFQTCVPVGCLVQLKLDAATLGMLRNGTAIKLTSVAALDGKTMLFTVPLNGLGEAVDRSVALAR